MTTTRSSRRLLALALILLVMSACGTPTAAPAATATPIPPADTPLPAADTPVPPTATLIPPAEMPAAPAAQTPMAPSSEPIPQRIRFAMGAVSAEVRGSLPAGGVARYVLQASAGQQMTLVLTASAPGVHAVLALWGADGTVLISGGIDATVWSGLLPATQDYYIDVRSVTATPINYVLDVTIPPPAAPAEPVPQRIQFAPGAISAEIGGSLPGNGIARYVLGASAGQQMSLNLTQSSAGGHAILALWGADGAVFISGGVDATAWSGLLPLTQDYYIDVRSVTPSPVNYILSVIIPPAPPTPEPAVQRIQFAPGAISAEIGGSLPGHVTAHYVLGAAAGQQLIVGLTDTGPGVNAILVIWGADGSILLTDHSGQTNYSGLLPLTQDYYIDVRSVTSSPVDYILDVTIPPPSSSSEPFPRRIQFAPGGTSATVNGTLPGSSTVRHVLGAAAGQTMTVDLTDSAPGVNAILIIWGVDGTVLISSHAGATHWSGILPLTEDYYIDIRSATGATIGYTLHVSIPPA